MNNTTKKNNSVSYLPQKRLDVSKKICVGDIVIVHSVGSIWDNKKGFIEEIIVNPTPKHLVSKKFNPELPRYSGKYSIYGLEKSNDGKWYFGHFVGQELELFGSRMSKPDLRDYVFKRKFSDPKVEREIPLVIENLGRCKGKNVGVKKK